MIINQKGFAALEGLLFLVIIAIISGTGYYVMKARDNTDKVLSQTANSSIQTGKSKKAAESTNYLVIKEWGIKVSLADADKLTYEMGADDPEEQAAPFLLKESVSSVCRELGIGVVRRNTQSIEGVTHIGKYYYDIEGGPGACDQDPGGLNGSINQLRGKIIQEPKTIQAL